jgi:type II secretory pathway pseudopilin PulG
MIELLVVMAIIAILAAIVLPAVNAARNRGYEADCWNNLSQIGKALANYCTTENKNTPDADGTTRAMLYGGENSGLMTALNDYGIATNSMSWYCKRHLKFMQISREQFTEMRQRTSYFYWAWNKSSGTGIDMLSMTTNTPWNFRTNNLRGTVLLSDPFYANTWTIPTEAARIMDQNEYTRVQFHAGGEYQMAFTEPGTPVLITGGAVQKIGPNDN